MRTRNRRIRRRRGGREEGEVQEEEEEVVRLGFVKLLCGLYENRCKRTLRNTSRNSGVQT
jgi:hypothetical protein